MLSRVKSFSTLLKPTLMPIRPYAHISAGKLKPLHDTELVQSDTSGFHKSIFIKTCKEQAQCHNRQCDSTHETVCPYKNNDPNLMVELAGALTHKIPKDKDGVELSTFDIKGDLKNGSQKMVREKTTVPVNQTDIKEHQKATEYVQQKKVAEIIKNHLPSNSPLNLKKTSECNPSQDEEI